MQVWERRPTYVLFLAGIALALLPCIRGGSACSDTVSPSAGMAGVKNAIDTFSGSGDYDLCLEAGTYTASIGPSSSSSGGDVDIDPSQIAARLILRGVGKTETTIDLQQLGGLFVATAASSVRILDMTIVGSAGSVVNLDDCDFEANDVAFRDSSGAGSGGALALSDCLVSMTDSEFTNNAALYAGAVYMNEGSLNCDRCLFDGNTASVSGGAVYSAGTQLSFLHSMFANNDDLQYGVLVMDGGSASFTGCLLYNNANDAVRGESMHISVANSVIAVEGGEYAVYNADGTCSLDNTVVCTDNIYCEHGESGDSDGSDCGTAAGDRVDNVPYDHDFGSCAPCEETSSDEEGYEGTSILPSMIPGLAVGAASLLLIGTVSGFRYLRDRFWRREGETAVAEPVPPSNPPTDAQLPKYDSAVSGTQSAAFGHAAKAAEANALSPAKAAEANAPSSAKDGLPRDSTSVSSSSVSSSVSSESSSYSEPESGGDGDHVGPPPLYAVVVGK